MVNARARKRTDGVRGSLAVLAFATAAAFSVSPIGAELTTARNAWNASAATLAPEVVTPVSDDFRRRIADATAALPDSVWRSLWHAGWRVQMAEFVVDAAPTLTGERPRGWPTGLTWENTDAVNLPHHRLVVVAEKRRNRNGEIVAADRIEGVLRHELGHAYDRAAGGSHRLHSAHPEFVIAYQRDLWAIPQGDHQELEYYLQGDAAGRQEAYAEAFAILLGGGSDPGKRDTFVRAFPRVLAFMKKTLAEAETANQTAGN